MEKNIDDNTSCSVEIKQWTNDIPDHPLDGEIESDITSKITITYYGKTYEFLYRWRRNFDNNEFVYVILPDEERSFDQNDLNIYFSLVEAINSGDSAKFKTFFMNYLLRRECLL